MSRLLILFSPRADARLVMYRYTIYVRIVNQTQWAAARDDASLSFSQVSTYKDSAARCCASRRIYFSIIRDADETNSYCLITLYICHIVLRII